MWGTQGKRPFSVLYGVYFLTLIERKEILQNESAKSPLQSDNMHLWPQKYALRTRRRVPRTKTEKTSNTGEKKLQRVMQMINYPTHQWRAFRVC
jgi:hypothetical protein